MAEYCTLVLYFHSPAARENTNAYSCNIQPYCLLSHQIIYMYIYICSHHFSRCVPSMSCGLSIFTLLYSTLSLHVHDLWPPFREWYHPSAILLSATLSQRVISALYDLSDVDFDLPVEGIDLDELWPSFVLWVNPSLASHTPHSLQRGRESHYNHWVSILWCTCNCTLWYDL